MILPYIDLVIVLPIILLILILLCATSTVVLAVLWSRSKQASSHSLKLNEDLMAQVRSGNANATKENNALRENVLQVSSKLTNIVKENNALRVNVVKETNALREQKLLTDELKVQIREVSDRENMTSANLSKANIAYNALREQAQQKLSQASEFINQLKVRYNRIAHWEEVQDNVEKAKEISKSVAILKKTARAFKNAIEGYGTKYIVPPQSILDELAKDAAHTDPGQRLKAARDRSREIVKEGDAAKCDDQDSKQGAMAANFVLDSFNGKVEIILASVKVDNIGTLIQKIEDAFIIVNEHGAAFQNARIEKKYLKARLAELQWAALVQRIKQEEREEQRLLKEQMREEALAQREFKRAEKEAKQKEESLAKERQLIEVSKKQAVLEQRAQYELLLREELKRVSEEQRVAYESRFRLVMEQKVAEKAAEFSKQLEDADARIKTLEEMKERAKSMAQQTKKGTVYIISNIGSFGQDIFKIGQTRRLEPRDRIWELGDASVPFEFDIHALIPSDDAPRLEKALHEQFILGKVNKMNWRKEFFRVDLLDIKKVVEEMQVETDWTMLAEAKQYRETQALEITFKKDPKIRHQWLRDQQGVKFENSLPNAPADEDEEG